MLRNYKHLQRLTLAILFLSRKQQAPTLISINKAPSVRYCNTVKLYAVFSLLSVVYFINCSSQYITERI